MSFLTPNKITWAKCPNCEIALNSWDGIPIDSLGSKYFVSTECPCCRAGIAVKVRIEFKVEIVMGS